VQRYALVVEYDGTDFEGWQSQPSNNTIQDALERALATCLRQTIAVTGSGRTDSGVHAANQIAHFDSDVIANVHSTMKNINGLLPDSIAVKRVVPVGNSFHSRFDAVERTYRYFVSTTPVALDRNRRLWIPRETSFDRMNAAAKHFYGEHNYSSFCRTKSETKNRTCFVSRAEWVTEDPYTSYFEVRANRFLHGMVRAMVGTMLRIGSGAQPADDIPTILQAGDRRAAGPAANPKGLVLYHVTYPDGSLPLNL
jgi:tRNA pseudouridine38-40 synthase